MSNSFKEKVYGNLSEKRAKAMEERFLKIRANWQSREIPKKIAKCIEMAYSFKRIHFLYNGIKMFFETSGIYTEVCFEMVPLFNRNEVGYQFTSEFFEVFPIKTGGDFIARYCEENKADKKDRDELLSFSHTLSAILRRNKIIQEVAEIIKQLKIEVINLDPERSKFLLKYYLVHDDDSLLYDVLEELVKLGFSSLNHGFDLISRIFD